MDTSLSRENVLFTVFNKQKMKTKLGIIFEGEYVINKERKIEQVTNNPPSHIGKI